MTAFVIVNPGAGRTRRDWPRIKKALESDFPLMRVAESHGRGEIARLVRAALKDGHLDIIAVGGDGTINEALNGFFDSGVAVAPDAVFSFVHSGHDSTLCRRFNIAPGWRAGVTHLGRARIHKGDVGCVACLSETGEPVTRYFLGAASFGLTGSIARAMGRARIARLFGHGFAIRLHRLAVRLTWRATRVRLMAEGYDEIAGIASVSLAPAGGKFDAAVLDGLNRARNMRAARLTAAPTLDTLAPVDVETDGESAGVLPATFEIYPAAINLRL
jgi:diacylglycerol kinase family enzyme